MIIIISISIVVHMTIHIPVSILGELVLGVDQISLRSNTSGGMYVPPEAYKAMNREQCITYILKIIK